MENIAILGGIIKYGILLICIIGLLRLWLLRNDKRKHYITIIITAFFTLLTIYIFGGGYIYKNQKMRAISGDFKLQYYKCEKCPDCIVRLSNDGTYILWKNGHQIDKGNWDYSRDFLTPFLQIENGSNHEVFDEKRTLSYIKNDNCQDYWRNQNLNAEFEGAIIKIDTINKGYGVYSIIVKDEIMKREFTYEPKYIGHPWLNDKIQVGDSIWKKKNIMSFTIKKINNGTIEVTE